MKKLIFLFILFICPLSVHAEELIPNAVSGILIEANSGKVIYEKDKDKQVSIASMTKMVAQIIIMEELESKNIHLNDIVTVSRNASNMGGSQIYLEEGEKITVEDLLKGISVASGNDATVAMAEYISGSEKKFVEKMNKKVKELGLKNTHFSNSTGLDEKNHYSTAKDMAIIARELIVNHPKILEFSSIYEDYLRENTNRKFWLVNTNKLIRSYEGADGLKTGHTDNAGYCLAATAKRKNIRLIAIVLGEKDSKTRNKETTELLDYGFINTKVKTLKNKGDIVKKKILNKSNTGYIDMVLENDLNILEDKDKKENYKYEIITSKIKYPIKKNQVVGKIKVLSNSKVLTTENLVSRFKIDKIELKDYYFYNLKHFFYGHL